MDNNFETEKLLLILQKIASDCEPTSEKQVSIELAAKAILFIHATGQQVAFQAYITEMEEDLTDEEKRFLATIGLNC